MYNSHMTRMDNEKDRQYLSQAETSLQAEAVREAIQNALRSLDLESLSVYGSHFEIYGLAVVGSYAKAMRGGYPSLHTASDIDFYVLSTDAIVRGFIIELFARIQFFLAEKQLRTPRWENFGTVVAEPQHAETELWLKSTYFRTGRMPYVLITI